MPDTNELILAELKAIRALLAGGAKPAAAAPASQPATQTPEGPPPQPDVVVENPGDYRVHFGKNNGTALSNLTERQLGFYASVKTPRLDNTGKPFPPRPADVALEQAARTLWHQQKGTLTTGTPPLPSAGTAPQVVDDDENIPY